MRITFVLPPADMTGGQRVVAIYADRLQRRGHHVHVVSIRLPRPSLRDIARTLLKERKWPFTSGHKPCHFDTLPVQHRRLPHCGPVTDADVPDADIIVATWWETAHWISKLPPAKGAHVHFMQDYETWGGTTEEIDSTYRLPIPKIVISGWMQELLINKFGQKPLALVPNSVDLDRFHAPPRGKQAVPTVGMVYARTENKGTDIAIKAYEIAARQVPNLRLKVMSNVPQESFLPLPATAEFHFQARDQQLRDIYAACDAWLFPSRWEGFGLPILEAMACRTPVIGTPAGAAPELLSKGGGILVPTENPQAMADAVLKVCALSEADWRPLSDAALATATGTSWDDTTTMFEKALQEVAQRPQLV